jgi:hypothetical protein
MPRGLAEETVRAFEYTLHLQAATRRPEEKMPPAGAAILDRRACVR